MLPRIHSLVLDVQGVPHGDGFQEMVLWITVDEDENDTHHSKLDDLFFRILFAWSLSQRLL